MGYRGSSPAGIQGQRPWRVQGGALRRPLSSSPSVVQEAAQIAHVLQRAAAAHNYAGLGILGTGAGHFQRVGNGFAQAEQLCAATGQQDAVFKDVGGQFGGGVLQHAVDALDQLLQGARRWLR